MSLISILSWALQRPEILVAIIFLVFVSGQVAARRAYTAQMKLLSSADDGFLEKLTQLVSSQLSAVDATVPLHALASALRPNPNARGTQRWVAEQDPSTAFLESAKSYRQRASLPGRVCMALAENLTAIALVLTFGLIALVLVTNVTTALLGADTGHAANEELALAVGTMGAKFFVSAAGLVLSLVFHETDRAQSARLESEARRVLWPHREAFVSGAVYREGLAEARHAADRALSTKIAAENRLMFEQIATAAVTRLESKLKALESVNVSVATIGQDVQAHLSQLMRNELGDRISSKLAELGALAVKIEDRLTAKLVDQFSAIGSAAAEGFNAVNATLAGRARQDAEVLRDTLSGGFQSESANMVAAMAELRDVLPSLAERLQRVGVDLEMSFRTQAEESASAKAQLNSQIQALVDSNREVQESSQQALRAVTSIAAESATSLQTSISSSGKQLVDDLMRVSSGGLQQVSQQLQQLNALAGGNVARFSNEIAAAHQAVSEVQRQLKASLEGFRGLADELRATLGGARQGIEAAHAVVEGAARASQTMATFASNSKVVVEQLERRIQEEASLLADHKELATLVQERLMPVVRGVFDQYGETLAGQQRQLELGWKRLAEDVQRVLELSTGGLAENMEELSHTMQSLSKDLTSRPENVA